MNDQYPSSDEEGLFGQLEGIDSRVLAENLDEALYALQERESELANQRVIAGMLEGCADDDLANAAKRLLTHGDLEAGEVGMRLSFLLAANVFSERFQQQMVLDRAIYDHIWRMGCVIVDPSLKRDVQARIIDEDDLAYEQKTIMLGVLDDIAPGEGVDIDDPDSVNELLSDLHAEGQRSNETQEQYFRLKQIAVENQADILSQYNIHPEDPVWKSLLANAAGCAAMHINMGWSRGARHFLGFGGIDEKLGNLKISREDYSTFVNRIIDTFNS